MAEFFGFGSDPANSGEKKVEYLELIYDLIFVYLIGRNNSLIQTVVNGFVPAEFFLTYILCTMIVIQIWMLTTLFINRYGVNKKQEHLAIFINMYLLYFMADGTRVHWQTHFYRYNIAWGLIILNLLLQYYLKYRQLKEQGDMCVEYNENGVAQLVCQPFFLRSAHVRRQMKILGVMAAIIFISLPLYALTGIPFTPLAMIYCIIATVLSANVNRLVAVDFSHLTERVMLYVVFTFGEMIIGIAGYFGEPQIGWRTIYFSLMAFLIVVGLFLSYGFVYDHVVDRRLNTNGTRYMLIHVFLIMAMSFITTGMEFMLEPKVAALPKNVFLTASFLMYFLCLSQTVRFAKVQPENAKKLQMELLAICGIFVILIALTYRNGMASIAVSVLFIYAVLAHLYLNWKKGQMLTAAAEQETIENVEAEGPMETPAENAEADRE